MIAGKYCRGNEGGALYLQPSHMLGNKAVCTYSCSLRLDLSKDTFSFQSTCTKGRRPFQTVPALSAQHCPVSSHGKCPVLPPSKLGSLAFKWGKKDALPLLVDWHKHPPQQNLQAPLEWKGRKKEISVIALVSSIWNDLVDTGHLYMCV